MKCLFTLIIFSLLFRLKVSIAVEYNLKSINDCLNITCYNGGTCINSTFECKCQPGYTGSDCSIKEERNYEAYNNKNLNLTIGLTLGLILFVVLILGIVLKELNFVQKIIAKISNPPVDNSVETIKTDYSKLSSNKKEFENDCEKFFCKRSTESTSCNNSTNSKEIFSIGIQLQSPPLASFDEYFPLTPESFTNYSSINLNFRNDAFNLTPLMAFILDQSRLVKQFKTNEFDAVQSFIDSGINVNAKNSNGETALHLAVRYGLEDITRALLINDASLHICDNLGQNPLHAAVSSNQYEILKLLLNYFSPSFNQLDENIFLIDSKTINLLSETSLIIAARLNYNSIMQLLIEFNASLNSTDSNGRSALHWCAKVNNCQGAFLLIKSGANVNLKDNCEQTPVSLALDQNYILDVVNILIVSNAIMSAHEELKYNLLKSKTETNNKEINTRNNALNYESIELENIGRNENKINESPKMNQLDILNESDFFKLNDLDILDFSNQALTAFDLNADQSYINFI